MLATKLRTIIVMQKDLLLWSHFSQKVLSSRTLDYVKYEQSARIQAKLDMSIINHLNYEFEHA